MRFPSSNDARRVPAWFIEVLALFVVALFVAGVFFAATNRQAHRATRSAEQAACLKDQAISYNQRRVLRTLQVLIAIELQHDGNAKPHLRRAQAQVERAIRRIPVFVC